MGTNTVIIETSDNRFYQVIEPTDPDLSHCWFGVEVKRSKGPIKWLQTAKAARMNRAELVRKAATRVVEA